jgi:hypothetical protein
VAPQQFALGQAASAFGAEGQLQLDKQRDGVASVVRQVLGGRAPDAVKPGCEVIGKKSRWITAAFSFTV